MPMRLATLRDGTPDGRLVVISADAARYLAGGPALPNLLAAIENWAVAEPALAALADELATGAGEPLDPALLAAPLPRSWQWLDGSAFGTHGELMQIAFNMPPIETDLPLMYQGMSDRFYGPADPVPFAEPPTASISRASSA
jgi:fumarylacetoacetate (FAA) hydrolase